MHSSHRGLGVGRHGGGGREEVREVGGSLCDGGHGGSGKQEEYFFLCHKS